MVESNLVWEWLVHRWLTVIAIGVFVRCGARNARGVTRGRRGVSAHARYDLPDDRCRGREISACRSTFSPRLIWKESRLRPNAVSPVGAQGIAQFMPQEAPPPRSRRPVRSGPGDPRVGALPGAPGGQLGNLGLAAAAYNAGEARVSDWLAGAGGLPAETQDYVWFITGRGVNDWKKGAPEASAPVVPASASEQARTCAEIAAALSQPGAGSAALQASGDQGSAAWAPWGVQLAGNFSEAKARASFAAVQKQYAGAVLRRKRSAGHPHRDAQPWHGALLQHPHRGDDARRG